MAGVQNEQDGGEKLHQTDQPEIENPAGQLIHMPADGDTGHLEGNGCRSPGGDEPEKGGGQADHPAA